MKQYNSIEIPLDDGIIMGIVEFEAVDMTVKVDLVDYKFYPESEYTYQQAKDDNMQSIFNRYKEDDKCQK